MLKFITILFVAPILLSAGLDTSKISRVLSSLQYKKPLTFYKAKKIDIDNALHFTSLDKADIILFPNKSYKIKKIVISDSYGDLRKNKKSIGAIYLRKGRTQIVFIKERLRDNGLILPKRFKKYIITECELNPICLLVN